MYDLYNKVKKSQYFIDNEYLLKYCELIGKHIRTKQVPKLTNKHHVIPKLWFKLNKLPVDNSLSNLVNIPYREHILAHYYLCLCTENPLLYGNQLALICLLSRNKINIIDKQLIQNLPLYNNIYENYLENKKKNIKFI